MNRKTYNFRFVLPRQNTNANCISVVRTECVFSSSWNPFYLRSKDKLYDIIDCDDSTSS